MLACAQQAFYLPVGPYYSRNENFMKVQPAPVPTKRKMYVAYPDTNAQCSEAIAPRTEKSSDAALQSTESQGKCRGTAISRGRKAYVSEPCN